MKVSEIYNRKTAVQFLNVLYESWMHVNFNHAPNEIPYMLEEYFDRIAKLSLDPKSDFYKGNTTFNPEYQITIGDYIDLSSSDLVSFKTPQQVMLINKDQHMIIEQFANTEIDQQLQKSYILNGCKFKISPLVKH